MVNGYRVVTVIVYVMLWVVLGEGWSGFVSMYVAVRVEVGLGL